MTTPTTRSPTSTTGRVDRDGRRLCDGTRTTWPWNGYPCGAFGKHEHNGKVYCGAHFAKAVAVTQALTKTAEKFEGALKRLADG